MDTNFTKTDQRSKWVSYDDVKETAETLQGLQKNVTGDNIREALGRGSKATITKHLRQWKSENNITTVDEASIPNHILQMVRELLKRIHEDADAEITEHKQAIDLTLSQTQISLHKIEQENATIIADRDQFNFDLKKERTDHQQLQNAHATLQNEKSALLERVASLESRNMEYKNEADRLHQATQSAEDRAKQLNDELTTERKSHTVLLEKLNREYSEQLLQLQNQLNNILLEKTELQTRHDSLLHSHNKLDSDLAEQKNNCVSLQREYDTLSFENTQLKNTLENSRSQNNHLAGDLANKNSENTGLYIQLKTAENDNVSIKNVLDKLEHKMQMLQEQFEKVAQEKAFLEGQLKQLQARKLPDSQTVG